MLREIRLFEAELLLDGPRGEFAVAQDLKNGDAGGMGERMKDIGLVCAQRLLHISEYIRYSEYSQLMQVNRFSRVPQLRYRLCPVASLLPGYFLTFAEPAPHINQPPVMKDVNLRTDRDLSGTS